MLPLSSTDDLTPDPAALIESAEPFLGAPESAIAALSATGEFKSYAAGETIFAMGQYDGSEFLVVRSGKVRATYADPSSGAMLFEDAGPGEVFGLAIAISGSEGSRAASMSLAAERSTEILAVDSESLRLLVQETPALAKNLMSYFARKLSGVSSQQEDASPERRVYAALLSFVQRDAVAAEWRIPKMPKHKELAQSADVDEAEAAAAVAKLIQSGVARRDYPGVVIEDMASLNRLAR